MPRVSPCHAEPRSRIELDARASGRGYAGPFISAAGFAPVWNQRGALQFHGRLEGRRWIIISHPGTYAHRYEASRSALLEALADAAG